MLQRGHDLRNLLLADGDLSPGPQFLQRWQHVLMKQAQRFFQLALSLKNVGDLAPSRDGPADRRLRPLPLRRSGGLNPWPSLEG